MEKFKEIISLKTEGSNKGQRLDAYISEVLDDATRTYIQKLIDNGNIEIVGKDKIKSGNKLKGNEEIIIKIPEDEILELLPEDIPLNIVYQDSDMVIINKTHNIIVHPAQGFYTGTLVNAVLYHIKDLSGINGVIRPGIVHRLDKDTSGLIIVAKNDDAHVKLTNMFKDKTIEKRYVCICKGIFKDRNGRVETLIGRDPKDRKKMAVVDMNGKNAITNYTVVDEFNNFSLVEVRIETGRTHQIRVHMKYLNHPILGDSVYGNGTDIAKRQMLHSYYLKFNHPRTGEEMQIVGELPEDFIAVAKKLKLDTSKIEKIGVVNE
ncbi:MAG: RluA family pseudouridine synthase [Cetobacterium sp.]|uniref:RluA family pseudouridine synthase n=1 Tax=unclassified Cetobacterium TaxID=2630983 RepID=UPI00163D1327|nr:RluA family pseudouridine synthase [Cetobacterium sp. 2A]MBC2855981.1 RluA family pseudouridine synthase [Cetobacterium sp. 2A]